MIKLYTFLPANSSSPQATGTSSLHVKKEDFRNKIVLSCKRLFVISTFLICITGFMGAKAQISPLNAWSNVYNSNASTQQTVAYTVPTGSNTNRILVVAIASSRSAIGAITVALSYGGQVLTPVAGDMATTTVQQHTQLYYLKETGLDLATSSNLVFTVSGGTIRGTSLFAAVFDGVDQTTPITDFKTYSSGTGTTNNPVFATALNVNANDQAVEIISSVRTGSTSFRTITAATNWTIPTTGGNVTWASTDGGRNAVANRSIPTTNSTDLSSTTISNPTLASMTGLSLKVAPIAITQYYVRTGGTFSANLQNTASWTNSATGSGGTPPSNFTTAGQVFNIGYNSIATASVGGSWTVSGFSSKIIVGDGTNASNFTVGSNYVLTAPVDVTSNGTLTLSTTGLLTGITFGTLATNSTVNYGGAGAQTCLAAPYYNLTYSGSLTLDAISVSSVSNNLLVSGSGTMTSDALTVTGNLTVNSGVYTNSGGSMVFGSLTVNTGGTVTTLRPTTINGVTNITGTINFGSTRTTARAMVFTGAVTLNSGAIWTEPSSGNGAANTYDFQNNFINNATTFNAVGTGVHTFSGTGMTMSGATTTSIANAAITGSRTNIGTLDVSTALTGAGTLTNGDGTTGTLLIGGTSTINGLTATSPNNTVNYDGAAQTVKAVAYMNLILSGTLPKTIGTAASGTLATGNLSITGTATASVTNTNIGVGSLTLGGLGRINGTWGALASAATNKNGTYFTTGVTGTINVSTDTRSTPVITWSNPADITYGTALSGTQLTAPAVPAGGTFVYSPLSGVVLGAGNAQTLSTTYTPTDLTSYKTATASVTINVNKKSITVSANAGQSKVYGGTDPTFAYTPSEALAGGNNWSGALARTAGENFGTYAYTIGSLSAGSNYSVAITGSNTFEITKATPNLAVTNSPLPYNGNPQSATVTGSVTGIVSNIKYNGSGIVPKDINTYAVTADFTPDNTNYSSLTGASAGNFIITSATSVEWAGAVSTNWNSPSNWIPQMVPVAGTSVLISVGGFKPAISEAHECAALTIETGAVLTIANGGSLTVNGTLTNNGTAADLVIAAGGSLIESTSGVKAKVEQAIPANQWHLITSPVNDAMAIATFSGKYLQKHTESSNVYADIVLTDELLAPAKGYALWGDAAGFTASFSGTLNAGPLSNTTTKSGPGWNLVGNPYPSYIDFTKLTRTNVNGAFYLHISSSSWGVFVGGLQIGDVSVTQYIAPCQGFFVEATAAGSIDFPFDAKTHTSAAFYKKSAGSVPDMVRLQVSGNGYKDEAAVRIVPESSTFFDGEWDGHKIFGEVAEAAQIYTLGSTPLAINSIPAANEVALGVHAETNGTYTIAATEINDIPVISLEDTKTGIFTNLSTDSYTFDFGPGESEVRFMLHFGTTGLADPAKTITNIYSYQQTAFIDLKDQSMGNIFIYNAAGQLVRTQAVSKGMNEVKLPNTGIYMVKVITAKSTLVKKIWIE